MGPRQLDQVQRLHNAPWHSVTGFLPLCGPPLKASFCIGSLIPRLHLGRNWNPGEVFLRGGSRDRGEPSRTSYSCVLPDSMLSVQCKMNRLCYSLPLPQCSAFLRSGISGDWNMESSETILLEVLYVRPSVKTPDTDH